MLVLVVVYNLHLNFSNGIAQCRARPHHRHPGTCTLLHSCASACACLRCLWNCSNGIYFAYFYCLCAREDALRKDVVAWMKRRKKTLDSPENTKTATTTTLHRIIDFECYCNRINRYKNVIVAGRWSLSRRGAENYCYTYLFAVTYFSFVQFVHSSEAKFLSMSFVFDVNIAIRWCQRQ